MALLAVILGVPGRHHQVNDGSCQCSVKAHLIPTGTVCFHVSLQDYSWYCLSVAVKKSSRTLLR